MIKDKYLEEIKRKVLNFAKGKNCKAFVFGSSLQKDHFGDIDIGMMGEVKNEEILKLKKEFKNSHLPYGVDIVNFNEVSKDFKNNVLNNEILWIIP